MSKKHTHIQSSTDCCLRGCRLYSIIELVGEEGGANGTLKSCLENCKDAYPRNEDGAAACALGCNSQRPVAEKWGPMPSMENVGGLEDSLANLITPMLYMHNMYSNMVDKVSQHMSVSWSFYMQDGTGRLVVMKSQPQTVELDARDFDDFSAPLRLANSAFDASMTMEDQDATATEMLNGDQMKSVRNLGNDLNFAAAKGPQPDSADWLSCIAQRTGLPRLLLCAVILLSAVAMIWLCMSAAVTAPEQRLTQHKLSINGDLEYLRQMMHKKGVHPQDFVEARPLPTKIRIAQL